MIALVQGLTKLVTTAGTSPPIGLEKTPPGWSPLMASLPPRGANGRPRSRASEIDGCSPTRGRGCVSWDWSSNRVGERHIHPRPTMPGEPGSIEAASQHIPGFTMASDYATIETTLVGTLDARGPRHHPHGPPGEFNDHLSNTDICNFVRYCMQAVSKLIGNRRISLVDFAGRAAGAEAR